MTKLNFKGKEFVYNHHLSVPFRPLVVHSKKEIGTPSLDNNLIVHNRWISGGHHAPAKARNSGCFIECTDTHSTHQIIDILPIQRHLWYGKVEDSKEFSASKT